jgi:GT2 family glycosyltransferase
MITEQRKNIFCDVITNVSLWHKKDEMNDSNMKIYVIIVTYNGTKWIDKCFRSLRKSLIPIHIIAVDNNSTDNTVEMIEQDYPEIELIKIDKNLGFGKGNNIGLRKALAENADYVFLQNQDAWIEPDTIEKLVHIAQKNQEFSVLSPLHLNGDGSALETKCNEYINVYDCPGLVSDKFLGKELSDIYKISFINAAAWLISEKCLKEVGGFDPLFPHYGEDIDYIERVKLKGFYVGIYPNAKIYHDSIFDWGKVKNNPERQLIFNFLNLKNLNGSFKSNLLVFFKNKIDLLTSLLLFRKFSEFAFQFRVICHTLAYINKIREARKLSLQNCAFLRNISKITILCFYLLFQ